IVPVDSVADAERLLRPFRPYLQCAALAGDAHRISSLSNALAYAGVTRIVPPGLMGTPSMMWHHDGMACLGKMIKWCDCELLTPEKALKVDSQEYVKTLDFAGFLKEKERKTYAFGQ
ncbi:MAG TPA: acyl-CoA reductase, partial [Blastocatellia bacterium]|nr:acyl-CoA reductase [Blastocatellia bacterium]